MKLVTEVLLSDCRRMLAGGGVSWVPAAGRMVRTPSNKDGPGVACLGGCENPAENRVVRAGED